ncbi:MFS general substrate transporter [Serendipita vermifera]|nr:MFS general substrate transporter [Serendipita vermifera]
MPLSRVSMIFACGTALFSDGYANGVIGLVNTILKRLYPDVIASTKYGQTLSSLAFAGTVVGMLVFGWISDKIGRKTGMMTATGIVALFSLLSAASKGANGSVKGTLAALSAFRFLLGIGVGAEYPCGSVAAAEQSEDEGVAKNAQHRWFVLATNTMIDFGFVISAFVPLVLYWIFRDNHLRAIWRISLGLGFIPAMAVFLWRLKMENPEAYKRSSMKHAKIPYLLILRRYWRSLTAVSLAWFLYDFIAYPFGIYASTVTDSIIGDTDSLAVIFGWAVVINLFYIPGTVIGAFAVDILGPKMTMISGLLAQAVIGFFLSGFYVQLTQHHRIAGFAVLYGIFLSCGEFGPGNCLGLLASKSWPTGVRGQTYGLAAAIGKVGAFVGTWAFPAIIDRFGGSSSVKGNTGPFWIGSGLAIASALIVVVGVRPLSHDGMMDEDEKFRVYLEEHGYDTSQLGLKDVIDPETGSVHSEKEVLKDHGSKVAHGEAGKVLTAHHDEKVSTSV